MVVQARNVAKHPTKHRTVPTQKHYLAQNANSAEAEKFCSRGRNIDTQSAWPGINL